MANYRAIASGNWSAGATWAGGAVPPNAQGHNVYSNNFTVTIDQNVNVALLTNAAITASFVGGGTSAAGGGSFSVTANGISVIANITSSAALSVNALTFSAISPSALSISGNLTGGGSGLGAGHAVNNSSTGIININTATITPGVFNSQANGVRNSSTGQVNLNNCVISGVGRFQEAGVYSAGGGVINASNCSFGGGISIYSTSSVVATNCTFTAATGTAALEGAGTLRLSGSFVAATNGRQPINAAVWTLNSTPNASYIQHALDGINANSFVRYYTADTNLGQADPTNVRSGVSYASGNLTGRLTVPSRGSVALSVNYGPSMPFTATRSGTTATATLAYSYPLVVGDNITVTGASNAEWNTTYTIASVVSGTSVTFEVPATHSATAGTGATMQTTGTAVLDPAAVASAVWGAATRTITGGLVDTATTLTNAPASVTPNDIWGYATRTLTTSSGPTAVENAAAVRTNLATELARIDAPVSGATAPSAAAVASQVRTELTPELAKVAALVPDRLAQVSTVATTGAQLAAALS